MFWGSGPRALCVSKFPHPNIVKHEQIKELYMRVVALASGLAKEWSQCARFLKLEGLEAL